MDTLTTPVTLKLDRIASLIISALEGGSNYWYTIAEFVKPEDADLWRFPDESSLADAHVYRHVQYPLSKGGALLIEDREGTEEGQFRLDLDSIAKGLQIMAKDCPRHYADILAENDDAITGDVFLQCCLFGKVIFG